MARPSDDSLRVYRLSSIPELFGVDLRSLALFRVALGSLLLTDLVKRAFDLRAHYTDLGVLPRSELIETVSNHWNISIHNANGALEFQAALFIVHGLLALLLIFGYRTRLVTIGCWLLLISLHARNPLVLSGGDTLFRMLLFWGMFLPLGARFSVDRALDPTADDSTHRYFSAATVGILLQVIMVYTFTVMLKGDPIWRDDHTAAYYTLSLDQYTTGFGHFLLGYPALLPGLTGATLWLELLGPFLAFIPVFNAPVRLLVVVSFLVLHLGIALTINIGLFPYISMASWLVFVPAWFWDVLTARTKSRPRAELRIHYDGDCGFCRKTVLILVTFMVLPRVMITPAQETPAARRLFETHNSWVVEDNMGRFRIQYDALAYLVGRSPLFWPLAHLMVLPPLPLAGRYLYQVVAGHRRALSRLTSRIDYRPLHLQLTWWQECLAVFFIAFIILWNIGTLSRPGVQMPAQLYWIGPMFHVHQKWDLFTPYPSKVDGWYLIPGKLKDGREVDLFTKGGPVSTAKPGMVSALYENNRWRKYLLNIKKPRHKDQLLNYGRYLCRDWNRNHERNEHLETFDIYFMTEYTLPDYLPSEIEPDHLWHGWCDSSEDPSSGNDSPRTARAPVVSPLTMTIP